MSKIVEEVVAANRAYANNFGDKGKLPLPPARFCHRQLAYRRA